MDVQYLKPESLAQALALLIEYDGTAAVMAGGTDLLVRKKNGFQLPACVIDLKSIDALDFLRCDEKGLLIGAATTIEALASHEIVRREYTALAEGTAQMASPVIRRMATIAGNLCNAAPSADTSTPLIALEASVKIVGLGTERIVPVEEMFLGPGKTILSKYEIVSEIQIPKRALSSASSYIKHKRRYGADLAVVGIAVSLTIENSVMKNVRIAVGAAGPTAFRAVNAERLLEEKKPVPELLEAAGVRASEEAKPITDVRGSMEYRHEMVKVLTKRAIEAAISRLE